LFKEIDMSINRVLEVATVSVALLCGVLGCGTSEDAGTDVTLRDGLVAERVQIGDVVDGTMVVEYGTSYDVAECTGVQAEVRELWQAFVRPKAEEAGGQQVLIMPLDPSKTGQVYKFQRTSDNEWREAEGFLPCR
jgi:hypothetical protein